MVKERIAEAVINGEVERGKDLAQQGLDQGHSAKELLDDGILAGMEVVGEKFKNFEVYIPEVLQSASVMNEVMNILKPALAQTDEGDMGSKGVVVLGTVEGDMHDIGKNLVGLMLEGAGFKVVDIGIDQPASKFVEAVEKEKPHVLGMSALLTTTAPRIAEIEEELKKAGLREKVKTMAGGAVIDQDFVDSNGVDAYGPSATAAIEVTNQLVKEVENNAS